MPVLAYVLFAAAVLWCIGAVHTAARSPVFTAAVVAFGAVHTVLAWRGAYTNALLDIAATDAFKTAILRDIEDGLVKGIHTVDYAFALGRIAHSMARMADHCTNVAEQVIYVASGKIVRHQGEKWTGLQDPGA